MRSASGEDNIIRVAPLQQLHVFKLASVAAIDAFHLKRQVLFNIVNRSFYPAVSFV